MIANIPVGNVARIVGTFTDEDGDLADPTEVTLSVTDPAGTEQELTFSAEDLSNPSVGVYEGYVELTMAGDYRWKIVGTGALDAERTGVINAFDHYASP